MTDPNGWPDASKPGVPMNPERDGWHWLRSPRDFVRPCLWNPIGKTWLERGSVESMNNAGWRYLGPCLTPQEVAAREQAAAVEMREAVRAWIADRRKEMSKRGVVGGHQAMELALLEEALDGEKESKP
jgi:hypothetical protein